MLKAKEIDRVFAGEIFDAHGRLPTNTIPGRQSLVGVLLDQLPSRCRGKLPVARPAPYVHFEDGRNKVADQTLLALAGQLSRRVFERYSHARKRIEESSCKTAGPASRTKRLPQIPPQQAAKKQESLI
jgi:hypothetical protein